MKLHFKSVDHMQEFFFGKNTHHPKIYDAMVQSIAHGIDNNLKRVDFCEISFDTEEADMHLESTKFEWRENLENALKWYTSEEEYEECAKIVKLIDKLC